MFSSISGIDFQLDNLVQLSFSSFYELNTAAVNFPTQVESAVQILCDKNLSMLRSTLIEVIYYYIYAAVEISKKLQNEKL